MESRFYQAEGIDIEKLANDLVELFLMQNYQAQQLGNKDQIMVQLKKGGDFQALLGMQVALTVTMRRSPGGVLAVIGQQKWVDKAAVGAVSLFVLWPLAFTAGAGAIRQLNLVSQVFDTLDNLVRQQNSNAQVSTAPDYMLAQIQQQPLPPAPPQYQAGVAPLPQYQQPFPPNVYRQPPVAAQPGPAAPRLHCPNCNTPYNAGDMFCSKCGHSFVPTTPKRYCASCGTEMKSDATFCSKCGAPAIIEKPEERTAQLSKPTSSQVASTAWGYLVFSSGRQIALTRERSMIGRPSQEAGRVQPDISLQDVPEYNTVSHNHAIIEHADDACLLTDLHSTNATRLNGNVLEPGQPRPMNDGDTLSFGKVTCTFRRGKPGV